MDLRAVRFGKINLIEGCAHTRFLHSGMTPTRQGWPCFFLGIRGQVIGIESDNALLWRKYSIWLLRTMALVRNVPWGLGMCGLCSQWRKRDE